MGAVDAEVSEETVDVVLETAYFNPSSIRATARRLNLSSDSSYRFERGIDPKGLLYASLRALDLICEVAGGEVDGERIEAGAEPVTQNAIELSPDRVRRFIGFEVTNEAIQAVLEALDLEIGEHHEADGTTRWEVKIPSYRGDLEREVDLIEEFVRLYGTDRIPESPIVARGIETADDRAYTVNAAIADYLTGQNFDEAFLYSLRDPEETQFLFGEAAHTQLTLENPLQSDQSHLRASLVPGLLDVLQLNSARGTGGTRFFERGRVFREVGGEVVELAAFSFVAVAESLVRQWKKNAPTDFYSARTWCENILGLAGFSTAKLKFEPQDSTPLWQGSQSAITGDLKRQGFTCSAGMLNVATLRDRWDLEFPVIAGTVEIKLECFKRSSKRARHAAISNQPSSGRDIALMVERSVLAGDVSSELAKYARKATAGFECESVSCFDIYEGKGLPEGMKSLAINFSFRASDRTLTDKEVNAAFLAIQEQIVAHTNFQIRK
jgi:phenylalanyl-tRNA synthetase beta chain